MVTELFLYHCLCINKVRKSCRATICLKFSIYYFCLSMEISTQNNVIFFPILLAFACVQDLPHLCCGMHIFVVFISFYSQTTLERIYYLDWMLFFRYFYIVCDSITRQFAKIRKVGIYYQNETGFNLFVALERKFKEKQLQGKA